MPYAANGYISQNRIPDGVEITQEQYDEALAGMIEGKTVAIDGGFSVAFPPEPEPEPIPEPDPIDPLTQPLDRVRFEFMRDKLDRDNPGFTASVEAMFDDLPEDTTAEADFKLLAKVLWRTGDQFYIHHGLFTLAVYTNVITQSDLESAWVEALAVTW